MSPARAISIGYPAANCFQASVVRSPQRDGDAGIMLADAGTSALARYAGTHSHRLLEPFDFGSVDLKAPLALGTRLPIFNRDVFALQKERAGIGLRKPTIKCRDADPQIVGGFLGSARFSGHACAW